MSNAKIVGPVSWSLTQAEFQEIMKKILRVSGAGHTSVTQEEHKSSDAFICYNQ